MEWLELHEINDLNSVRDKLTEGQQVAITLVDILTAKEISILILGLQGGNVAKTNKIGEALKRHTQVAEYLLNSIELEDLKYMAMYFHSLKEIGVE